MIIYTDLLIPEDYDTRNKKNRELSAKKRCQPSRCAGRHTDLTDIKLELRTSSERLIHCCVGWNNSTCKQSSATEVNKDIEVIDIATLRRNRQFTNLLGEEYIVFQPDCLAVQISLVCLALAKVEAFAVVYNSKTAVWVIQFTVLIGGRAINQCRSNCND